MLDTVGALALIAFAWLVYVRLGEIRDAIASIDWETDEGDDEDGDDDDPDDGERVPTLKAVNG